MANDFERYYTPPQSQTAPIQISPIFALLVILTLGAGMAAYIEALPSSIAVFLFAVGGWVISLSLHEFGHAIAAYYGGDKSVVNQGYLTLNPLKYTHGMLSIVWPILILALGGIGLPGGAVYINMGAIRSKGMRSLVSAAGPIATALCGFVLLTPFVLGLADLENHLTFWAGMALLAFLQITALLFNLLPIPGLDGFGIIAPFLPDSLLASVSRLGSFTLLIILVLFMNPTPVSRGFWTVVATISQLAGLDFQLVGLGLDLFQFWRGF